MPAPTDAQARAARDEAIRRFENVYDISGGAGVAQCHGIPVVVLTVVTGEVAARDQYHVSDGVQVVLVAGRRARLLD